MNNNLLINNDENIKFDLSASNMNKNELKSFLNQIEANPKLIKNLSDNTIDLLIDYYKEIIKLKQQKLDNQKKYNK